MKEKLCLMRDGDVFKPFYGSDLEFLKKCKEHQKILCTTRRSRNPEHHKLVFAIAKCILSNLPSDHLWGKQEPYDLIKAIMIEEKIVNLKLNLDGTLRVEAKSINFESMSQDEFQPVSDAMFKWGAMMLGIEPHDLEKNYMEYL